MATTTTMQEQRSSLGSLRTAALVGSAIEWYDFFIYGTAAALFFGTVFFPNSSPAVGTLLAFSTFWAGFLARPLGALVFGHIGDKYGRKPATVACLAMMGVATCLIGILPGAATFGIAAPIILVFLRFMQGIAAGGQWGGIILLLTEHSPRKRRGFSGVFGQLGVPVGLALGNAAFMLVGALMNDEAFAAWGWRVPFFISLLLIPVAYYIHVKVEDSPVFQELQLKQKVTVAPKVKIPLWTALKTHKKQVLCGAGMLFGCNAFFYASVTGLISYGTTNLGLDRNLLLLCVMSYVIPASGAIIVSGLLSDRLGRRPLIIAGAVLMALWGFPFFWLVNTGSYFLIIVAIAGAAIGANLIYGPYASYMTELFAPEVRYSGMGFSYQLSSVIVSGGTPVLVTALIASTGSTDAASVFLLVMGACSLVAVLLLKETNTESFQPVLTSHQDRP
ncbi:MFS transporter [bacterium RCC_150]